MPIDITQFHLSKNAKAKLKDKKIMHQELSKGIIPQKILQFSDETMAQFYRAAYALFEEHRYTDAAKAFLFLATLNPDNHEYWLGLGMATQMNHEYESAIDAYELAALCNIASPVPYFYLAKCLFAIHDRESSLEALNLAIEMAGESDDYFDLKIQAMQARNILLNDG